MAMWVATGAVNVLMLMSSFGDLSVFKSVKCVFAHLGMCTEKVCLHSYLEIKNITNMKPSFNSFHWMNSSKLIEMALTKHKKE